MRNPEKYEIQHLIVEGKIRSRGGAGRRRTSWLKNLRQWYGKPRVQLFRHAVNRTIIVNMVANMITNDR